VILGSTRRFETAGAALTFLTNQKTSDLKNCIGIRPFLKMTFFPVKTSSIHHQPEGRLKR